MKILVIGLGYVGTANAVLLSQHNEVVCYDLNADRINLISNKKSPIEDKEASEYLSQKKLNLRGVSEFPTQMILTLLLSLLLRTTILIPIILILRQ